MDSIKKEKVLEVLSKTHLMSLATIDANGPWVADVIFIFDEDLNLYWMSNPNSRHSRAIQNNNKVAGTITFTSKSNEINLGIQFSGIAEKIEGDRADLSTKHLAKRNKEFVVGMEVLDGDSWYKIKPNFIGLIDEENFGYERQDLILS